MTEWHHSCKRLLIKIPSEIQSLPHVVFDFHDSFMLLGTPNRYITLHIISTLTTLLHLLQIACRKDIPSHNVAKYTRVCVIIIYGILLGNTFFLRVLKGKGCKLYVPIENRVTYDINMLHNINVSFLFFPQIDRIYVFIERHNILYSNNSPAQVFYVSSGKQLWTWQKIKKCARIAYQSVHGNE